MTQPVSIFEMKISLLGTKPLVWRRLLVPSNISLNNFAFAINLAMGWENAHLYLFQLGNQEFGDSEFDEDGSWRSDREIKIFEVARDFEKFLYIYDFGDGWQHEIRFEKERPADSNEKYPKCIDGANACPPEDCGGIGGFDEYKKAIKNRSHPRHRDFLEWRGPYDANAFDLEMTNLSLIRRKIGRGVKLKTFSEMNISL